jgi:mRNA interferase HigB
MHVISRKKLRTFWREYPDSEEALAAWFRVARSATWEMWADAQANYTRASYYECCQIFNVCGNAYRLVVRRSANWKTLFVVGVYTHKEYDRDLWKQFCTCR